MSLEGSAQDGKGCFPIFTYESPPSDPVLIGDNAVVSFYNNWMVSQMFARCIPCTCFCPDYQQEVADLNAHKLLSFEKFIELIKIPETEEVACAYNTFKGEHDALIESYQKECIHDAYSASLIFPFLLIVPVFLNIFFALKSEKNFNKLKIAMNGIVKRNLPAMRKAGLDIIFSHLSAPTNQGLARFPWCCRTQADCYSAPYSTPVIVICKKGTKPPKDLDELTREKNPEFAAWVKPIWEPVVR